MKHRIERKVTVECEIDELDVAEAFCNLDGDQQARFFNVVARLVHEEWKEPFAMKLEYMTQSKYLSREGRNIMRDIGDYHKHNIDNQNSASETRGE